MQSNNRIRDDASVASRYLADQLSPAEREAYEQYFIENPEAVHELEATARMKVGLANLRNTGQLEGILKPGPATPRRQLAMALVASLAIVAVGVGLWRGTGTLRDPILFADSSALMQRAGRPLTIGASYPLLRTRASDHDALIELPSTPQIIELRVRPESTAARYRATLSKIAGDGSVTQVAAIEDLRVESDRFVRLYFDSSTLAAGPYLLVLSAPQDGSDDAASSTFRLKVSSPEDGH